MEWQRVKTRQENVTAVQVRSDEVPVKGNGRQLTLLSSYCVPAMMLCDLHTSAALMLRAAT